MDEGIGESEREELVPEWGWDIVQKTERQTQVNTNPRDCLGIGTSFKYTTLYRTPY